MHYTTVLKRPYSGAATEAGKFTHPAVSGSEARQVVITRYGSDVVDPRKMPLATRMSYHSSRGPVRNENTHSATERDTRESTIPLLVEFGLSSRLSTARSCSSRKSRRTLHIGPSSSARQRDESYRSSVVF